MIIKSECSDVLPYLELIQAFTLNKRQFSFEYMKASLQGSIEFITQSIDEHIKRPGDTPDRVMDLSKQLSSKVTQLIGGNEKSSLVDMNGSIKSFV